ncbi:MAG: hypothetical protein ACP5I3_09035 [Thermoproteus sp.]
MPRGRTYSLWFVAATCASGLCVPVEVDEDEASMYIDEYTKALAERGPLALPSKVKDPLSVALALSGIDERPKVEPTDDRKGRSIRYVYAFLEALFGRPESYREIEVYSALAFKLASKYLELSKRHLAYLPVRPRDEILSASVRDLLEMVRGKRRKKPSFNP